MILPGYLTICKLEEDVPTKSYFRIRPLFTKTPEGLQSAAGSIEQFPDEGGIRIVPDKNEALRFKHRMRTLGGYCLLDLTRHTGENDKIRINKNYSPERGEFNRHIVYSDVITECPDYMVMEAIVPEEKSDGSYVSPAQSVIGTRQVLLRTCGTLKGPYIVERQGEDGDYLFVEDSVHGLSEVSEDALNSIEMPNGSKVQIFISEKLALSEKKEEAPNAEPVKETAPAEAAVNEPEKVEALPVAIEEALKPAQTPTAPAEVKPEESVMTAEPVKPAPKPAPKAVEAEKHLKPGIRPQLRKEEPLNPRRGKSLSEVVDESWRRSRLEHLGASMDPSAESKPALSPVDKAAAAFKEAWTNEEARKPLLEKLMGLEEMPESMKLFNAGSPLPAQRDAEMDVLEAERLKLMREVDKLKSSVIDTRAALMDEARAAHKTEIDKMEAEKQQLDAEIDARKREAATARDAQLEAARLLNGSGKAKLDSEFLKFAMFTKAAQLLKTGGAASFDDCAGAPESYTCTAAQLISDLRSSFEASGRTLAHDEAVNLLVIIAMGAPIIVSGATGAGKTSLCDSLAGALGLNVPGARRYARIAPDVNDARKEALYMALYECINTDTLRFVLLDDINARPIHDQSRSLMDADDDINVLMTALDDGIGYPLDSRLLDRSFLIRIEPVKVDGWQRCPKLPYALKTPSAEAFRKAFISDGEVPSEIAGRMAVLKRKLEALGINLSLRTMGDMYTYCASAIPLMTASPLNAFDLAFAQRALPGILATAKLSVLKKLPELISDLPISLKLLDSPLALPPM